MSSKLNIKLIKEENDSYFEVFQNEFSKKQKEIAKRLKDERKSHNYSQEKLADLLNCSRQTIASWEKINSNTAEPENVIPPLNEIIRMRKLYDCDLEYLLCLSEFRHYSSELLSPLYGLTDETLTLLKEHSDFITSTDINNENGTPDFQDEASLDKAFFLSFVNHLICKLLSYPEVMKYIYFEKLNYDLENDKYEKLIRKAFSSFHISSISQYPFYDINNIDEILVQLRYELYISNIPYEECANIINYATRYIPLLCTETRAIEKMRFNIAIDDIISSYVENKNSIEDNYLNFIVDCINISNNNSSL